MVMKKILLLITTALLLIASNSQAAFTPLNNGDYRMVINEWLF